MMRRRVLVSRTYDAERNCNNYRWIKEAENEEIACHSHRKTYCGANRRRHDVQPNQIEYCCLIRRRLASTRKNEAMAVPVNA